MDDRARALRRQGIDIVSFATGEPDFDTPAAAKEAAIKAINDGFTKYTSPAGIPELREAVADRVRQDYGAAYEPSEIVITAGGKPALYFALLAICEPGDEVLLPVPAWVSYAEQIRLANGRPVFVPTDAANGWQPLPDRLAPLLTRRTRAIILNSPHNPTGAVYTREALANLVELAERHDFYILSDEIYASIVYDGARHVCAAAAWPGARDRIVLLNSMSKTFAMPGWRIGFAAAPAPLAAAVASLQGHLAGNPNSIAQKAALAALLMSDSDLGAMVAEYDRRRRYVVRRLNEVPGIACPMPHGAFYAFADVRELLGRPHAPSTSLALAEMLLDRAHVAVVPGEPFEAPGYLRISYATAMDRIAVGMDRIAEVLAPIGGRI
ncbi:MAG: pyridoxal phosphate-dependent aminotransferase [bacterium]